MRQISTLEQALKCPVEAYREEALRQMSEMPITEPRLVKLLTIAADNAHAMGASNRLRVERLCKSAAEHGFLDGCAACSGEMGYMDQDGFMDDGGSYDDGYYDDEPFQGGADGDNSQGSWQGSPAPQSGTQAPQKSGSSASSGSFWTGLFSSAAGLTTSILNNQAKQNVAETQRKIQEAKAKQAAAINASRSAGTTTMRTSQASQTNASRKVATKSGARRPGFFARNWGKMLVGTVFVAGVSGGIWYYTKD